MEWISKNVWETTFLKWLFAFDVNYCAINYGRVTKTTFKYSSLIDSAT